MKIASIAGAAVPAVTLGFGSTICGEARPLFHNQEGFNVVERRDEDPEGIKREAGRFCQALMKESAREADRERGFGDE